MHTYYAVSFSRMADKYLQLRMLQGPDEESRPGFDATVKLVMDTDQATPRTDPWINVYIAGNKNPGLVRGLDDVGPVLVFYQRTGLSINPLQPSDTPTVQFVPVDEDGYCGDRPDKSQDPAPYNSAWIRSAVTEMFDRLEAVVQMDVSLSQLSHVIKTE